MKRLLIVLGLLFATPAWANQLNLHTNISADNALNGVNSNFQAISDWGNGNVEGSTDSGTTVSNIKESSVFRINLADDADVATYSKELLNITTDSFSSGTLTTNTTVESGCVPADDTDLTSDVSACVMFVNGIRVSKAATAVTYTATRDCYVDLSDSGVYTATCVAVGATQPAVTANSGRLAKVVTDGTEITSVTTLFSTRVPGLVIPSHYRTGLRISYDTSSTILVGAGSAEINNTIVNKTTTNTLTLGTAGDWAGGVSLRAVNTYAYVGMDASGNLKLHTTAPTHDNYAVSTTAGKLRYATWSSTVYRILGWFWMNSASSGSIDEAGLGNIKEGDVDNSLLSHDTSEIQLTTTATEGVNLIQTRFYSSGGKLLIGHGRKSVGSAADLPITSSISIDGVGYPESQLVTSNGSANTDGQSRFTNGRAEFGEQLGRGTHTLIVKWFVPSGTGYTVEPSLTIEEQ